MPSTVANRRFLVFPEPGKRWPWGRCSSVWARECFRLLYSRMGNGVNATKTGDIGKSPSSVSRFPDLAESSVSRFPALKRRETEKHSDAPAEALGLGGGRR